jgi:hypothetical protein
MEWLLASLLNLIASITTFTGLAITASLLMVLILVSSLLYRVIATPIQRMLTPTLKNTHHPE